MNIRLVTRKTPPPADALVLGYYDNQRPTEHPFWSELPAPVKRTLKAYLGQKNVRLNWPSAHIFHVGPLRRTVVVLGFGKRDQWTMRRDRLAARHIVRLAHEHQWRTMTIPIKLLDASLLQALAENLILADYEFREFRQEPSMGWPELKTVTISTRDTVTKDQTAALKRGQAIAESTNLIRDLVNMPGGSMTPAVLASTARRIADENKLDCRILDQKAMEKLKMGALLGVASGSNSGPRLITLEYHGGPKSQAPLLIVGKGVTFDSGGLNLKPGNAMNEMHMDMAGGAAAIGAITAIAKMKLPLNVVTIVPAVENMPSGSGFRPGDVLKSLSGKTIEIGNTDAEGRLVLADALTYGFRTYKPRLTVDLATLTGAAMVALGQQASALFTPDDGLRQAGMDSGERSGDYVWPLPMWEEYASMVKGTFGDLTNSGKSRWGGAIEGAMFLAEFTAGHPWIHLDIAPTMSSVDGQYLAPGATGAGVRWVIDLAQRLVDGTVPLPTKRGK